MGLLLRSRARLLFFGCLLLAGYFVYTAVVGELHNRQLNSERAQAAQHEKSLLQEKVYLEAVKKYVASDAYVEQQARRQLGYTRVGEIPFVVISPPPKQAAQPIGTWWERLFPE